MEVIKKGTRLRNGLLFLLLTGSVSQAGLDQLLLNFQQSDFEFGKVESRIPYPPMSWAGWTHYSRTDFNTPDNSAYRPGSFEQDELSQALILPVSIQKKDMFLAGEFFSWSRFNFREGGYPDKDMYTLGLFGAWIRQLSPKTQVGAFAAPLVSTKFDGTNPEGKQFYTGGMGLHRWKENFTWLYGGVYEYNYGDQFVYPYVGFLWLPSADWSVSFVAPWPCVTYALTERFMLRAGFVPSGTEWTLDKDGESANLEFGSWNLMAGGEYRLNSFCWLYAGAGLAGFRSFELSDRGDADMQMDMDSDPVVSVSLNFRPPGGYARAP